MTSPVIPDRPFAFHLCPEVVQKSLWKPLCIVVQSQLAWTRLPRQYPTLSFSLYPENAASSWSEIGLKLRETASIFSTAARREKQLKTFTKRLRQGEKCHKELRLELSFHFVGSYNKNGSDN
jgi:hypothetical protein